MSSIKSGLDKDLTCHYQTKNITVYVQHPLIIIGNITDTILNSLLT